MRIGRYRFEPTLIPTLATLLGIALLNSLGFWQLERAEEKQEILARFEQRSQGAALRLDAALTDPQALEYRRVQAQGVYDESQQIWLDNRIHRGRVGYEVITPLRLAGSTAAVLVNRGWVPRGAERLDLPNIDTPPGRLTVSGTVKAPSKALLLGHEADTEWPLVLAVEPERLERHTGYRLLPYLIMLDPDEPHGFVRDWQLFEIGPERHLGYAFQWFALAVALGLIYLTVNLRREGEKGDDGVGPTG
jgi:surfeit locus 1 family protein